MNSKQLAKELEYKSTDQMLQDNNITASNLSHIKKRSGERYKNIINSIVLKRYGIDTDELIKIIKDNRA